MSGRWIIKCVYHDDCGDYDRLQENRVEAVLQQIAARSDILAYIPLAVTVEVVPGMYDVVPFNALISFMTDHKDCPLLPYDTEKGEYYTHARAEEDLRSEAKRRADRSNARGAELAANPRALWTADSARARLNPR